MRDPQIAVAGDGSALAVWGRPDILAGPLQSSALAPGAATWGPVQTVPGYNDWLIDDIKLRLDKGGDAVATWTNVHTDGGAISSATRPANGSWTEAQGISSTPWQGPYGLAMDPDGKAIAVWPADDWGGEGTAVARVRPRGSAWGTPSTLLAPPATPAPIYVEAADVALDPAGRAVAVWAQRVSDATTVYASWRPAGGAWSAPRTIAQTGVLRNLRVAMDGEGAATVAWTAGWTSDGTWYGDVYASRAPWNGTTWEPPAEPSSGVGGGSGGVGATLDLAVDPGGKAIAIWTDWGRVTSAIRPAGGSWLPRQALSADGGTDGVVALDAAGDAVAAWQRRPAGGNVVAEASTRPQGGDWSAPHLLSPAPPYDDAAPAAAIGPAGEAMVVWKQGTELNRGVAFAVYDRTPPTISALSVPPSAVAGTAITVSMGTPVDRWSAVDRLEWDFGDGATASGASATHAYAAPGSYVVTARAADAAGNTATRTGQVLVTVPPVEPPKPGTTGQVGGVTAGLPGATPGSAPAPNAPAPGTVGPKRVRLSIFVPAHLHAGTRTIIRVGLNRAVRGALVRIQLRRGVAYRTIAQGRVSGRRIPVALTFERPGRYLLRVQIRESGRATVSRVASVVVRR